MCHVAAIKSGKHASNNTIFKYLQNGTKTNPEYSGGLRDYQLWKDVTIFTHTQREREKITNYSVE